MVDENLGFHVPCVWHIRVQIPLWSMKTALLEGFTTRQLGSDSSMVDENLWEDGRNHCKDWFRFLYGR